MTARQLDYIKSLATERETGTLTPEQQQFVARIMAGHVDPTAAQASRVIEALLALPRRETRTANTSAAVRDVAAGRYALVADDGVVKFYTVDRPTEGKWAGRTFVNAMGSDTRYPIRNRDERDRILATIAEAPETAMRLYASELGRCGYCGRELTDETSRAAGIGPDCAARHGIDRSVWATQAEAERAARLRSAYDTTTTAAPEEDGAAEDIRWSNEFAAREAEQERAAYAAEMEMERAAEHRDPVRRSDPSRAMGWQQRRAAVAAQQGRTDTVKRATCSQMTELPGSTWEDIFGMGGSE